MRAAVQKLPAAARRRVLAAAGVTDDLLRLPAGRVSAGAFGAVWLAVARELDDEFFGLDTRRMKPGSFALLCRAMLHTHNLEHALRRGLKAFSVFLDRIAGKLHREGGDAVITLTNRIPEPAARRFADETYLILVHGLMCWLTGRRIALRQASFSHPMPAHAEEYGRMFTQAVVFGAESTAIRFDAEALAAPIVQSEATLAPFLRAAPQSVFMKYRNENSWTARVRRRLRANIAGSWPSLEQTASEFHTTAATLRRRLDDEGSSYRLVKDGLRRDAAIHLLGETSFSIPVVAEKLGFQDVSAFRRAFRKWTGTRPGTYRPSQQRGEL